MKRRVKETYDRRAVGVRLKERRNQLGWSRKYVAERLGLVEKYYADIERGTCGMSVETLMGLVDLYGFSMDFTIYGTKVGMGIFENDRELLKNLENLPKETQTYCMQMLLLLMKGINSGNHAVEPVEDVVEE